MYLYYLSLKLEEQGVLAAVAAVAILCNLAYSMENNDSRLVYVPKREFVRVLSEIVSGPNSQQDAAVDGDPDSEDEGDGTRRGESNQARARITTIDPSPSSRVTNQTQIESQLRRVNQTAHSLQGKKGYVKSDSLYFLQKSLELRESEYKERYRSGDHQLNADHGPELTVAKLTVSRGELSYDFILTVSSIKLHQTKADCKTEMFANPSPLSTANRSYSGSDNPTMEVSLEKYNDDPDKYFSNLEQLRRHAEATRKKESEEERKLSEYLPVNEKFSFNKEGKVLTRWQERQRDWNRIQLQIERKLRSKIKRPLMMTTADEYRAKMEELDLLQASVPDEDRFNESSWQAGLRGGGAIRQPVGHIFSGLECKYEQYQMLNVL